MAKYNITYGCGCTVTKQLTGKIQDRESYIAWAATQDCPECKRAKHNAECQRQAEINNFPALDGSEKQIAWATSIRQQFLDDLQSTIDERLKRISDSNHERAMVALAEINTVRDAILANETSAKWWIDKRYDDPRTMINEYARNPK